MGQPELPILVLFNDRGETHLSLQMRGRCNSNPCGHRSGKITETEFDNGQRNFWRYNR
jgi:hypothetical protein